MRDSIQHVMNDNSSTTPRANPLGHKVSHPKSYEPDQLFAISRQNARSELGLAASSRLPFYGEDVWNCYEVSWLTTTGMVQVAMASFRVPASSSFIVESKSVKLYLNGFNQSRFPSPEAVRKAMTTDLSRATGSTVEVELYLPGQFQPLAIHSPSGTCIDGVLNSADCYDVNPDFLHCTTETRSERLYSHLLRTRCPVTDQPDWATLFVDYSGPAIDHAGLLRYLISYREHNGFHENCVERIFTDLQQYCQPETLLVEARFTRRGGIDINPIRASFPVQSENRRLANQ